MYQWFVFTHLIGLVMFVFAHGVSAFVSWQIRTLRDPAVITGYLAMSQQATRVAYVGLLAAAHRRRRGSDRRGPVVEAVGLGLGDRAHRRVRRHVRLATSYYYAAPRPPRRQGRTAADRRGGARRLPRLAPAGDDRGCRRARDCSSWCGSWS